MKIIKLTLLFLFTVQSVFGLGKGTAKLDGSAAKESLRLLWVLDGWVDDVEGFNVKRREKGEMNWELLNNTPIYPEINRRREWSNLGLSGRQEQDVIKIFDTYNGKKFKPVTRERFSATLKKVGMRSGDRIRVKGDFNLALIMGFGYIDNTYRPDLTYEYGLFGVKSSGLEIDKPLAVYSTVYFEENDERLQVKLSAEKRGNSVKLSWKCSKKIINELGLLGFHVYRRRTQSDKWKQLVKHNLMPTKKGKESDSWLYEDSTAMAGKPYYYAVVPTNNFQQEFTKTVVKYIPPTELPLKGAIIKTVKETPSHVIRLDWQIDSKFKERVKGVYIERFDKTKRNYEAVSEVLQANRSWWDDKSANLDNHRYTYRVITLGYAGELIRSKSKSIVRKGPDRPEPVENLSGIFLMKEGKGYVRLNWDKPNDSSVEGYLIYDDDSKEGKMLLNASRPLLKKCKYDFEIKSSGGRNYTFELESLNSKRFGGHKKKVIVYVPALSLPRPADLAVTFSRTTGNFRVEWSYPVYKDLTGFVMTLNGKPFRNVEQLPGETRAIEFYGLPSEKIN